MNSLNIAQFCDFIFLGDFNINYNDPSHHLYSKLCNISHFLNLTQVVTGSTHTSPHGNPSLIDLAFMSSPCQLLDCCVIPPIANSDHNGLKIRVNWKPNAQSPRPGQNTRTIWHYAHADFDKAQDLIHNIEWDTICTSDDVDSCWAKWKSKFLLIMEESIPKEYSPHVAVIYLG